MQYTDIIEDIKQCDALLIGIGSEFSNFKEKDIEDNDIYQQNKDLYEDDTWLRACVRYSMNKDKQKLIDTYNKLLKIVENKNYFIISSNMDGILNQSDLNPTRMVSVCGNINVLQCGCKDKFTKADELYKASLETNNFKTLICPDCNEGYEPNIYKAKKYNENSYIKKWNLYNKWLQGTLNKKLLILELGTNYNIPTIMRWPFEKITFINANAVMYRVSQKHAQIPVEVQSKAHSIFKNSIEFIEELIDLIK
ncbi:MAG: hypothetical protein E7252_06815 [Lachnospira sp.]|nr:hypothetical protein [Lachnospira sp.]